VESCQEWRKRKPGPGLYRDVYDGKVWKQQEEEGYFDASPYRFALMLNIDWFKPFKHRKYSVGAMYLTVLNLPREERFRKENMLLVGVIPGPGEPNVSLPPSLPSSPFINTNFILATPNAALS